jgi:hypothetical protein
METRIARQQMRNTGLDATAAKIRTMYLGMAHFSLE